MKEQKLVRTPEELSAAVLVLAARSKNPEDPVHAVFCTGAMVMLNWLIGAAAVSPAAPVEEIFEYHRREGERLGISFDDPVTN